MSVQGPPLCYLIKTTTEGEGVISGDQTKWGRGVLSNTSADQAGKVSNLMCIATHVPTGLYRLIL